MVIGRQLQVYQRLKRSALYAPRPPALNADYLHVTPLTASHVPCSISNLKKSVVRDMGSGSASPGSWTVE